MTSAQPFTAPAAATLSEELSGLLYRYGDLIRAERAALEDENVRKASMLAKSAEAVLAQANRIDRHLASVRSAHQPDTMERREMDWRLSTATAHVREQVAQLASEVDHIIVAEQNLGQVYYMVKVLLAIFVDLLKKTER